MEVRSGVVVCNIHNPTYTMLLVAVTPLHYACMSPSTVAVLLPLSPSPTPVDNMNYTPLHACISQSTPGPRSLAVVKLLLGAGCDPFVVSKDGARALELATDLGDVEAAAAIEAKVRRGPDLVGVPLVLLACSAFATDSNVLFNAICTIHYLSP